ncbi:exopolysaccharide production repressor exox, partial [bacterium M00.F.Ca.ET.157.01.1.1]
MSLPKFIVGMIFALAIVVGWSYFDGASLGTIVVRAVLCAVIIQLGYFLLVFAMIARSRPLPADRAREAARGAQLAEGEQLT